MNNRSNYIYIVGVGRSGTSLLQSMLNAHPNICFLPETQFFRKYLSNKKHAIKLAAGGKELILKKLELDTEFQRLTIDQHELISKAINNKSDVEMPYIYSALMNSYADREDKNMVGDKDPKLIECLDRVIELFPDSLIINLIRDPRDVILSRLKADWSKNRPFILHVLIYYFQLTLGRSKGQALPDDNYIEIRYEDLITAPEESLKTVCDFLSVQYSDHMLNFQKSASELVDDSEMQWKSTTLGPLLSKNFGKWKNELSPTQVLIIESVCGRLMNEFQYAKSGYKASFSNYLLAKSLGLFSPLFYLAYLLFRKVKGY